MHKLEIKVSIKNTVTEQQWLELHNNLQAQVHRFLFTLIVDNKVIQHRKEQYDSITYPKTTQDNQGLQQEAEVCDTGLREVCVSQELDKYLLSSL